MQRQGGGGCGCGSIALPGRMKGGSARATRKIHARGGKYKPTRKNHNAYRRWKKGKSIGFTMRSHLKAIGMIPRASGKKMVSNKYKERR
jgi:hypothetical protein